MQRPIAKTTEQPGISAKLAISCAHCGAVNPPAATSCYQCNGELPQGSADALDPTSAGAETNKPLSRPRTRLTADVLAVGGILLATLVFFGYHAYKMFSYVDIRYEKSSQPTTVSGEVEERQAPGASGTIGRATAGSKSAKKVDQGVASFAAPASTSRAVPEDAARPPVDKQRASRQTAAAHTTSKRESPRAEPCSEARASVGLCSPPGSAAIVETPTVVGSAPALPRAKIARKAVERARPRAVPCTEGVLALGLCTMESVKGKE